VLCVQVRLQCVQTLRAVFQTPDRAVAVAYIHALAPRLIEMLYALTHAAAVASSQCSPPSELDVGVALEGLKTLECLVALVEPQNSEYLCIIHRRSSIYNFFLF
jgi:hypothetical protein